MSVTPLTLFNYFGLAVNSKKVYKAEQNQYGKYVAYYPTN